MMMYKLINKGISYCEQERTFADRRHLEEEILTDLHLVHSQRKSKTTLGYFYMLLMPPLCMD